MKILCVADIHGRRASLDRAIDKFEQDDYDLFLQIGDLEDSFDRTDEDIQYCLERVSALKSSMPERVILLLGNHAGNYLPFGTLCSGYRPTMAAYIKKYYQEQLHLFQVAWGCRHYLITHAVVGRLWIEKALEIQKTPEVPKTATDIATWLNGMLHTEDAPLLFEVGVESGGCAPQGGPTWLRPAEAHRHDILADIHQIAGHTPQEKIRTYTDFRYKGTAKNRSLTVIDVLGKDPEEFYVLTI